MNSVESVKISAGSSASGDKHLQPSHKKPEKDEKEKAAGGDKAHRSLEVRARTRLLLVMTSRYVPG